MKYDKQLFVESTTTAKDENGDWISEEPTSELHADCLVNFSGAGREVRLQDGTVVISSAEICMPKRTALIESGAKVVVYRKGIEYLRGKVIRFEQTKYGCRIWV